MLIFKAETEKISKKKFNGVEHLIVPIIALVEGVITSGNADGVPQLALAEEFGNHPSGWDGRPVLVDHPTINGELVSANIPEVLESEEIGKLFNTRLEDKKLKTEAWINLDLVKEKGGIIASTIKRLEDGEMVEISTGLFADTKDESGMHNNEKFEGVWQNVVPDHLAILSEAKGACSIEDGCGAPRSNSTSEDEKMKINEDCECKTSPCSCEVIKKNEEEDKKVSFFSVISKLNIFKKQSKMSDTDIRHALNAAIKEKNPNAFVFLESVFKDSFVFQDAMNGDFFLQSFKIENDGSITLGEDVEQVRPELDFVPVKINVENEDNQMDKEKFVTDLIANESTAFNSDDKDWLIELDENRLEKLMPPVLNAKHDDEEDEEKKKEKKNEEKDDEKLSNNSSPETTEDYIKAAPAEMRDVLSNGLQLHNDLRANMITGIIANTSNQFSEEELKNFDIAMLKKLSTLAVVVDYSGQGTFRDHTSDNDMSAPEVPKVFQNANETNKES